MIGFEREDEEITRYYEKIADHDIFGIWGTELLMRLPMKKAEKFMKPGHGWTDESWDRAMMKKDHAAVVSEIEDFFQDSWDFVIRHRGLSASRSVVHFLAWSWLLNDMELFAYLMDGKNYPNYGAPLVLAVAQKYDLMDLMPHNSIDYEVFMNMAKGQRCSDLCPGLCGVGNPREFRAPGIYLPRNGSGLIIPK